MATTKAKATAVKSEQIWDEANQCYRDPDPIGYLNVRKVVTESVPIQGGGTGTYGAFVDEYISECLEAGEEVQSFEMEFSPDQWAKLRSEFKPKPRY